MDSYSQLIEKIAQASKLATDDIERRVEAKRAKLSGLVSKEGAAQIVAAELGINFEQEKVKIAELNPAARRAHVIGKVIEIFPVRSYNKNGKEGKVANLIVADESASSRVVLWDMHHIALIEQEKIKLGDVVEVSNAMVRNGELHLSSFADIKHSSQKMDKVQSGKSFQSRFLKDAKPGQSMKTRAFVVQVFDPRYFEVCPECGKKVMDGECGVHGKVAPKRRALLNIVLDDGSETLRSVLFGEHILKLGFSEEEIFSLELFAEKKKALLGEEKMFLGSVKSNALYNTVEFSVENVEEIKPDSVIAELEAKA